MRFTFTTLQEVLTFVEEMGYELFKKEDLTAEAVQDRMSAPEVPKDPLDLILSKFNLNDYKEDIERHHYLNKNRKIPLVREIRHMTGLSLKDAKDIADVCFDMYHHEGA